MAMTAAMKNVLSPISDAPMTPGAYNERILRQYKQQQQITLPNHLRSRLEDSLECWRSHHNAGTHL